MTSIGKYKITLLLGFVVCALVLAFSVYQFFMLRKAHSTFENYYVFRGCQQLIEKTDTYGTCVIASGQTIKIVKIGDRWFLDGDGPGVF